MPKSSEMTDQEYVEAIVKPIVDNPDDVVTTRALDERGVLISLSVNPADMGKVIGREGRTAKAVRSLLRVFGARSDARINLKIVEPDGGEVKLDESAKPAKAAKTNKPAKDNGFADIPEKADETEQVTSVI